MLTDIEIDDTSFAQTCREALVRGHGYASIRETINDIRSEMVSSLALPSHLVNNAQQTGYTAAEVAREVFGTMRVIQTGPTFNISELKKRRFFKKEPFAMKKYEDIFSCKKRYPRR